MIKGRGARASFMAHPYLYIHTYIHTYIQRRNTSYKVTSETPGRRTNLVLLGNTVTGEHREKERTR
jgi:hypothetical protein